MIYTKICEICIGEFDTDRSNTKVCSDECRHAKKLSYRKLYRKTESGRAEVARYMKSAAKKGADKRFRELHRDEENRKDREYWHRKIEERSLHKICIVCQGEFQPDNDRFEICSDVCRLRRERYRSNKGRSTGRKRLKDFPVDDLVRFQVHAKFSKPSCQHCGAKNDGTHQVDHIIPVSVARSIGWRHPNIKENLQVLCVGCHKIKTSMDINWARYARKLVA